MIPIYSNVKIINNLSYIPSTFYGPGRTLKVSLILTTTKVVLLWLQLRKLRSRSWLMQKPSAALVRPLFHLDSRAMLLTGNLSTSGK